MKGWGAVKKDIKEGGVKLTGGKGFKDVKKLSSATEQLRAAIKMKVAQEKERKAEELRQANIAHKKRLAEAGAHGRDSKALTPEQEAARAAVAERSRVE